MNKATLPGSKLMKRVSAICSIVTLFSMLMPVTAQATSIWNPTLLVNTESFNSIDEGDGTTDVELRFGSTAGGIQKLIWDISESRFDFSRSVYIRGDLTATGSLSILGTMSGANLHVDEQALINKLSVSGATVLDGAATFNGATTINSTLDTTGAVTTHGDLTINEDNGAADATLTFGNDGGVETLKFNDSTNEFDLSDDLNVTGTLDATDTITTNTNMTINADNGAADAVLTFGNDGAAETLKFNDVTNQFEFSDDVHVENLTASGALSVDGSAYIKGTMSGSSVHADGRLSASGALVIEGAGIFNSTLSASGAIKTDGNLTINGDGTAADATMTFGNDAGAETFKFNDTTNRFEMSDDLAVSGNLSGSTLTVDGNVTLHGVTYSLPTTSGVNGQVLTTGGDGSVTWSNSTVGVGSGGVVFLSPEYPHAVYFGSGANYIGQLSNTYDATNKENYYHWTSTKVTLQDYWTIVRVRIPNNFSTWDAAGPITLRYRTADGVNTNNYVNMKLLDTTGAAVALTGGSNLASATWATATITGPQSAGTYTKDGYITILLKLASLTGKSADAGWIQLNWETNAP